MYIRLDHVLLYTCTVDFNKNVTSLYNLDSSGILKLLFALKNTVPVQLSSLKLVCILGRYVANFHDILESLPGIITSYEVNLLKTEVRHNLRLIAANFIKNIQYID